MGDCCKVIKIECLIQENGIIRIDETGELIGRMVDGKFIPTFGDLMERFKETK